MDKAKKKATPKRKVEYVNDIIALSEKRGIDWNRKNLEDKTTIPNLKSIIELLSY
jgi:hypothetical protein